MCQMNLAWQTSTTLPSRTRNEGSAWGYGACRDSCSQKRWRTLPARRLRCLPCRVHYYSSSRDGHRWRHVCRAGGFGDKIIHPFGDFLLHDIGTGDGIVQVGPQDTADKLRTAPLWGLRTKPRFMHDLRSLSLEDAITRHNGEAQRPPGGLEN